MSTLKEMTAKDAKNRFGELLDSAQRSPISITKNGRDVAVLVSREEYERLEEIEDALWAARATEASQEGFLGTEESETFLKKMLDAKD